MEQLLPNHNAHLLTQENPLHDVKLKSLIPNLQFEKNSNQYSTGLKA